jgi:rhamnosyl/mannosyltransferase
MPESVGGTERFIDQLARSCQKYDIETEVLSLANQSSNGLISFNGYKKYLAKRNFDIASNSFSFGCFSIFKELATKADVIHYHFPWPFMDIVHLATKLKKPSLVTYHSDIFRQRFLMHFYRPLRDIFLTDINHIVATSPNYFASSKLLSKYRNKVSVIPIGLDRLTYPTPSAEKLSYWRKRLGSKFFLFVGVLRYYKGLHILIEAAKGVDYPVVIVGSGPMETDLKQQAKKLGLHNIYFLGHLPDEDKIALLVLCFAVVFPSHVRSEAFGIFLLEGAMHGKPMISCEIETGTSFINVSNETGLVVPPNDSVAFQNAMQYLCEFPQQAAEMGRAAEARYWQYFTADAMAGAYFEVYRGLLKNL